MTALGVDPLRLTPFAYKTAHRDKGFRLFLTQKISSPNLVLCIQHPFAVGHRIVMTSSELQRYFRLAVGAEIEMVEERQWPTRFNTMFSQFEKLIQEGYNPFSKNSTGTPNTEDKTFQKDDSSERGKGREIDGYKSKTTANAPTTSVSSTLRRLVSRWFLPLRWSYRSHENKTPEGYTEAEGSPVDPERYGSSSLSKSLIDTKSSVSEENMSQTIVKPKSGGERPGSTSQGASRNPGRQDAASGVGREKNISKMAYRSRKRTPRDLPKQTKDAPRRERNGECTINTDVSVQDIRAHLKKLKVHFQLTTHAQLQDSDEQERVEREEEEEEGEEGEEEEELEEEKEECDDHDDNDNGINKV
ncbi:myelin transcription factor 1-like [Aplysia californica]|uniref:Myelin transcription factor 1-like n=1 Tax=Aplysia californica TaxID=6500 RepID=A0ABM1W262_APLCA|nr:myelin transcription factor 1-like [Aplysia californica]